MTIKEKITKMVMAVLKELAERGVYFENEMGFRYALTKRIESIENTQKEENRKMDCQEARMTILNMLETLVKMRDVEKSREIGNNWEKVVQAFTHIKDCENPQCGDAWGYWPELYATVLRLKRIEDERPRRPYPYSDSPVVLRRREGPAKREEKEVWRQEEPGIDY